MKCRIVDYSKPPVSHTKMKSNIQKIVTDCNYSKDVTDIIISLYDYMIAKNFFGACHAFSSVLFVAFSELGLNTQIFIGECQKQGEKAFDHSWITIDGKIIDIAVYYPLTQRINTMSGPIIFDIDAVTMKNEMVSYGINTGLPLSIDTQRVIDTAFDVYMSGFPREINGLWTVLKNIMPNTYNFDLDSLKEKYADTKRIFVR